MTRVVEEPPEGKFIEAVVVSVVILVVEHLLIWSELVRVYWIKI